MANEHKLLLQRTVPIPFTCADGTTIEKGTVLKLADPDTASASTGASDIVAGICVVEKIASDGRTKVSVIRGPGDQLRATASGAIAVGDPIGTSATGANFVASIVNVANLSGMKRLGYALETAATNETFKYELNIGSGI